MSLIDEIRIAQRDAGEAIVIRNLERLGLGSISDYATAEETASVIRQGTPDELWLNAQLDRIAPNRFDADVGESDALVKLVFELRNMLRAIQPDPVDQKCMPNGILHLLPPIVLSASQLHQALEFVAPDYDADADQRESNVSIQYRLACKDMDGVDAPAGWCCWLTEYPDEGSILLSDQP